MNQPTTNVRGTVVLFGSREPVALECVTQAAEQARLALRCEPTLRDAETWLAENHPAAIVLDVAAKSAEDTCLQLRYRPQFSNVPILGLTDAITDLGFEEVFGWGGDDLTLRNDPGRLGRRLRALAAAGDIPHSSKHGMAIVADVDPRWRVLTARALRNAGYNVTFAADAAEALQASKNEVVELVVSTVALEEKSDRPLVEKAREQGVSVPWVIAAPPRDAAKVRANTSSVDSVAVYDAFGSPENVLFVANELLRRGGINARSSPRLLYGTTVRFRISGAEDDEVGYCYNINAGGLYVRTLAPLARGSEAWLELCPPRSDRRVRLEGTVAWSRGFGPNDSSTVPPGFGIQITGGSSGDLERYVRCYQAFAADLMNGTPRPANVPLD